MHDAWGAYTARENALRNLERAIAATPDALDARFYYGSFLAAHGRLDDAIAAFETILERAPGHVDTLLALGVVLARRGRRFDARAVFERAVRVEPQHPAALVNLANALSFDEPQRARALYEQALTAAPDLTAAHRGLCSLDAAEGDAASAALHRRKGYPSPFGSRPYLGRALPISVIALVSTDGGNIPLGALLDEHVFLVHELFVEVYVDEPLPPHAFVVNAIADADRAAAALERAAEIVEGMTRPVFNEPRAVAATGRAAVAETLARIDDVVTARVRPVDAATPIPPVFPAIVRVAGTHMGARMERADDAAAYLAARERLAPAGPLIDMPYIDTRSPDGAWRKYRVMAIDGELHPLHLAISEHWNVHYFSSAMRERADYRAEEAQFLRNPWHAIGQRAHRVLQRIAVTLALGYAGIDFGLDADDRVVVFEANAAMTILAPDDDPRFNYRRAATDTVNAALVRALRARTKA